MKTFLNALRVIMIRYQEFGRKSAWTATQAFVINFYLKIANRLLPARVHCPCCGWRGYAFRVLDIGELCLEQIECPQCRTHDRHRMLAVYLQGKGKHHLAGEGLILHVSPEPYLKETFEKAGKNRVISVDIAPEHLTHALGSGFVSDLQALALADASVQTIFCIHVLEHIRDDAAAAAELRRVLAPDGTAVVMIPLDMTIQQTDDWGAPQPQLFDHYRNYSYYDAAERLQALVAHEIRPEDLMTEEEQQRWRIRPSEKVMIAMD